MRRTPLLTEVKRFTCARDALMWLEGHEVNLAVLEIELTDENDSVDFPPQLRIIREVTDDPSYKNAALAEI